MSSTSGTTTFGDGGGAAGGLANCYVPLPYPVVAATKEKTNTSQHLESNHHHLSSSAATSTNSSSRRRRCRAGSNGIADTTSTITEEDRAEHGLRQVVLESDVLPNSMMGADGGGFGGGGGSGSSASALVELGDTKVLCQVIGPIPANNILDAASGGSGTGSTASSSSSSNIMEEGIMQCEVRYSCHATPPTMPSTASPSLSTTSDSTLLVPTIHSTSSSSYSSIQSRTSTNTSMERDLASRLCTAITSAIQLVQYPRHVIYMKFSILQDDGNIFTAAIIAASLALCSAHIELYDCITACSVAIVVVHQQHQIDPTSDTDAYHHDRTTTTPTYSLLADPTWIEENSSNTVVLVTMAMLPNWKEITLYEQVMVGNVGSSSSTISTSITTSTKYIPPTRIINEAMELCRDGCRTIHKLIRDHVITITQQQQEKQYTTDA